MKKFYSVNELCSLTKISARTLHHYDEINILKPHHRTSKGHRRYSEEELMLLQQIVTFKYLGFTLKEIKKIITQRDFNFFDSLKRQENAVQEQITHFKKIAKLINYLIVQHELSQPLDWQTVIRIIEVLKFNHTEHQNWCQNYLTDSEQERYHLLGCTRMEKWKALFDEIKNNLEVDPTSKKGIKLVKKVLTLATDSYGDQHGFLNKLWEAFKAGIIPSQLQLDKKVIVYISKGFKHLKKYNYAM